MFYLSNVTGDQVILVYAYMNKEDINMGVVQWFSMRKVWVNSGYKHNFGGLMTLSLKGYRVEEDPVDYKPP